MFLTGEIERFGTGTLEMYNLTIHETIHDTVHDTSSTFTEIAELTHRLVLVIQGEMSRTQLMEILELKTDLTFQEVTLNLH